MHSFSPSRFFTVALAMAALAATPAQAGFYYQGISPANVPWVGGTVPYVIDPALSPAQRQAYLDGIREWELAGNIHFVPHTTETNYAFFKYDPNGPNSFHDTQPQIVERSCWRHSASEPL